MTWIIVDVETNGPIPEQYEMTSLGAVVLDKNLSKQFYMRFIVVKGIGFKEIVDESVEPVEPKTGMKLFAQWLETVSTKGETLTFVSDNNGFDWQFVNYYFHKYHGSNPFGFSSRRIGDLYSGLVKDASKSNDWRTFVKTIHDHNPLQDAIGHAEALLHMIDMGLNIGLPTAEYTQPRARRGDWFCKTCAFSVFASKPKCLKCGTLRPDF